MYSVIRLFCSDRGEPKVEAISRDDEECHLKAYVIRSFPKHHGVCEFQAQREMHEFLY